MYSLGRVDESILRPSLRRRVEHPAGASASSPHPTCVELAVPVLLFGDPLLCCTYLSGLGRDLPPSDIAHQGLFPGVHIIGSNDVRKEGRSCVARCLILLYQLCFLRPCIGNVKKKKNTWYSIIHPLSASDPVGATLPHTIPRLLKRTFPPPPLVPASLFVVVLCLSVCQCCILESSRTRRTSTRPPSGVPRRWCGGIRRTWPTERRSCREISSTSRTRSSWR